MGSGHQSGISLIEFGGSFLGFSSILRYNLPKPKQSVTDDSYYRAITIPLGHWENSTGRFFEGPPTGFYCHVSQHMQWLTWGDTEAWAYPGEAVKWGEGRGQAGRARGTDHSRARLDRQ